MIIGFDGKRALYNKTGLGNYSRNILQALLTYYPDHQYYIYSPKKDEIPLLSSAHFNIRYPTDKLFQLWWRSVGIITDLKKDKIDLYHGLSNEIPYGIKKTGIPAIVTIHDLLFLRFPELYPRFDRIIYKQKCKYACNYADRIIAVSNQTKQDIIDFLNIVPEKISVIYQPCDKQYYTSWDENKKTALRLKYNLPETFLLTVGTIEKRKNLLNIIKAIYEKNIDIPLVVIGKETNYATVVKDFIFQKKIKKVIFLKNVSNEEMPGFYQCAEVFIYLSLFEGFGIPILEAMVSGVPVLTSAGSCFHETGGDVPAYVDPLDIEAIGEKLLKLLNHPEERKKMITTGKVYAQKFADTIIATELFQLYRQVLDRM